MASSKFPVQWLQVTAEIQLLQVQCVKVQFIMVQGSTQDDEHLCGKKEQSLWLQVLKEHNYSTTGYIYW
jgi:hypothetical protein